MPDVTVIVPARDAAATLPAALDALAAQEGSVTAEVLVADDGSTDATAALAAAHPVVARVLPGPFGGPGAARNAAATAARAPVLAFTDSDCVPDPGWLRAALAALADGADVVQGPVRPAAPAGPWDHTIHLESPSPLWETANLVVRAERFAGVGGFEPWLRPRGGGKELGEDTWLGWRLRRAGARVTWAPEALVLHAVVRRRPEAWIAERARLRFFCAFAARIPELRDEFFFRRWFLNRRRAEWNLALAGGVAARAVRRPALALLGLPYAVRIGREARFWGRRGPVVAASRVAGEAMGTAALLWGSARFRALVL